MPTTKNTRQFRFLPLTISLETLGGVATPLVLRGTPLPAQRTETFSTAADNQTSVELKIYMGESALVTGNLALGSFHLTGIPPQPKGAPQVEVTFEVDSACTVTARSVLIGGDVKAERRLAVPKELSEDVINSMLAAAEAAKAEDDRKLRHMEAVREADQAISDAGEMLKKGANADLNSAVAQLGLALQANNLEKVVQLTAEVKRLTNPFAGFDFAQFMGAQKRPRSSSRRVDYTDLFGDLFDASASQTKTPPPKAAAKPVPPKPTANHVREPAPAAPAVAPASHGPVLGRIFGGGQGFALDPQLCFVLMPFSDSLQPIYDDHIRPTVESAGLVCQRADDVVGTNAITWDIWERINRARFLIADLTNQNANVFYELGLAHAISKDVVLLTQSMDFVPFDLKSLRCIVYDFTPRGVQKLQSTLKSTIDALMKSA